MIQQIRALLPSGQLRKWTTGPGYRSRFYRAASKVWASLPPQIGACSFQERTLRASKQALLHSYNSLIGGVEGRGIGFKESLDNRGRKVMKHSFVNMNGFHEIKGLENQILVVLFMSWFIADQYRFYKRLISRNGVDRLALTVVSDTLSGDGDLRRPNEENLRCLIDPDSEGVPIVLTRSPKSDTFAGDLLADNTAGWLNAAIRDSGGEFGQAVAVPQLRDVWGGWHLLQPSSGRRLDAVPALSAFH